MGKALGWARANNSKPHRESSDRSVFIGEDKKRGPNTVPFHPGSGHVAQRAADGSPNNSKGTEGIRKKSVKPHDGIEVGEIVD
jgi:hypothetical protein